MAWEHQGWGVIRCPALCAVVLVAALLGAQPVVAAGVVGTGRPGSCTEAALDAALAGGGSVTFDCGQYPVTITITSAKTIAADTAIDGGSLITISGGSSVGVFLPDGMFLVDPGVNFTVRSLTIADGLTGYGAGIWNQGGTVAVTSSTFSGNHSAGHIGGGIINFGTLIITNSTFSGNGSASGGGIDNNGTLTVTNSSFSDNSATYSGGGIANRGTLTVTNSSFSGNYAGIGGGIVNGGTLTVTNSTFYDNSTTGGVFPVSADGGGIYNGSTAALTVTNSTFSRNRAAGRAGAIAGLSGAVTITNTIIANSTSGGNCSGIGTDGGHNIDDGATCGFAGAGCASSGGSSFCNTNPQLDPARLAYNGGPTQTIALVAGSPAIDAGDESVCAAPPVNNLDQRGYLRPGTGHTVCSIGSYEADGVPPGCLEDAPATGCLTAAKSLVVIKNDADDDTQDKLVWKWLKGAETSLQDLGDPTETTSYTLCLYAGSASATIALPLGSNWQTAGWKGFKYKDKSGTPDGARKALLKSGAAGKAKAMVTGKGTNLPDTLAPMLALPVTVQLVNDTNSTCFEAVYDSGDVIKNDAKQFKAKSP